MPDEELRASKLKQRRELWDRQRQWLCPPSTGWSWWVTKECCKCHQTKPRMGLYRDGATLYKCTPTKTADHFSLSSVHTTRRKFPSLYFTQSCKEVVYKPSWEKKTYSNSYAGGLQVTELCLWLVCSEVNEAVGLCFSWAPCFGFTWPRSSTPPSTHSRPTERFSAASAFQMRHSNKQKDTLPFNYTRTHSHYGLQICGPSSLDLKNKLENISSSGPKGNPCILIWCNKHYSSSYRRKPFMHHKNKNQSLFSHMLKTLA